MTKEEVKTEFTRRVKIEISKSPKKFQSANGLEKLEAFSDNIVDSEAFGKKMTKILNQIIIDSGYDYESNETDFLEFIKPTYADLFKEYLLN